MNNKEEVKKVMRDFEMPEGVGLERLVNFYKKYVPNYEEKGKGEINPNNYRLNHADLEKLYKTIQQEEIELAKKQGKSMEDVKVGVGFLLINNGPARDESAPKGKVLICNEEFGNEENFLSQSSLGM